MNTKYKEITHRYVNRRDAMEVLNFHGIESDGSRADSRQ
jgi:hypothetical protein